VIDPRRNGGKEMLENAKHHTKNKKRRVLADKHSNRLPRGRPAPATPGTTWPAKTQRPVSGRASPPQGLAATSIHIKA